MNRYQVRISVVILRTDRNINMQTGENIISHDEVAWDNNEKVDVHVLLTVI